MDELIRIEHLRKVYVIGTEKVVALEDINLTIHRGEVWKNRRAVISISASTTSQK